MSLKIRFRPDGPLVLDLPEGTTFELNGETQTLTRAHLALCRCGHSERKPLCDGSHRKIGFQAAGGELIVREASTEQLGG